MKNPAKDMADKMTVPRARQILPPTVDGLGLNAREMKWVAAYCTNGFSAPEAARVAGYKVSRKEFNGLCASMIKRPQIIAAVRQFIDAALVPYKDRLEYEVMEIYYRRATYDVATFMEDNGDLKPLDEIPVEWRCCIDGIERRVYFNKGTKFTVTEYKLPARDVALQMIYKMATGNDPVGSGGSLPKDLQDKLDRAFKTGSSSQLIRTTKLTLEQTDKVKGATRKVKGEDVI